MRLRHRIALLSVLPALGGTLLTVPAQAGADSAASPPAATRTAPGTQGVEQRTRLELLRRAGLQPARAQESPLTVERVTLRLSQGGAADAVSVVARRPGRGAAVLPRSAELGSEDLVVVAVDDQGRGLSALVVADPRVQRDEQAGLSGLLTGGAVRSREAQGVVDLPADPRTRSLRVYRQTDSSLTLLGTAPAPPPGDSGTVPAPPAPTATLQETGPAENRVDVVVLGDGYTADETQKFSTDAQAFAATLLAEQPFSQYSQYINIRSLEVVSAQSGADHPELSTYVDTAFDATYNCGGTQRRICVDTTQVSTVLGDTLPPAQRDVVLVLVNDPEYGGSGGSVAAVASTHTSSGELALHELGHSFGQLADEYAYPGGTCSKTEPAAVNATRDISRTTLKWRTWVDPSTPLPTMTTTDTGVVGAYEGALASCVTGVYRPTYNSKMRSLNRPFEQVNVEQLVRRIYAFVRPIEAVSPSTSTVVMTPGSTQTFSAAFLVPSVTSKLTARWTLNSGGVLDSSVTEPSPGTSSFALPYSSLKAGSNVIRVDVSDPTQLVRHDPAGALRQSYSWTVQGPVAPGTYQESHAAVAYTGMWATSQNRRDNGGAVRIATDPASSTVPATASLTFTGKSVSWVARKAPTAGQPRVFLDGVDVTPTLPPLDLYNSSTVYQQTVFTMIFSQPETHTLRIEHSGAKRTAATDDSINLDGFIVG